MMIRRIVLLIGALIALIGLSQIAAAHWWLRMMPWIMAPPHLRVLGIVALVVGAVLTIAAVRRAVCLRLFVLILGILMLLGGAVMLVAPGMMRDTVYAYFLNRPHESLVKMAYAGGLARTLIGAALVYAATKPGPCAGSRDERG